MNEVTLLIIAFLAGFGASKALDYLRNQAARGTAQNLAVMALVAVFMVAAMPVSPAMAQSSGLNIDLQPIWDGINNNLPWALLLMGAIGGISIALGLGEWIISLFMRYFRGRR